MPIIYTYPVKATANDNDLILISDSQDSNKTKQIKIGDLPGGSSSGVSSVTATLPVVSSGGSTPVISLKDLTGFGTAGQVIKVNSNADGLEWGAAGGSTPSAPLNSVQFNNNSAFGGSANLTFTTNTLAVTHTVDVKGDGTNAGKLKLYCENTTTPHAVTIEGPAHNNAAAYTLKLPSPAPSNQQILQSDGSGVLSWINTPSSGGGGSVDSVNTTDGTYINLTPNSATTGAVTVTADLSAVNGTSDTATRFLSKDNTWDIPSYTTDTTYDVMGSGNSYAAGLVLAGAADHQSNFLRKDGTWQQVSSGISFSGSTANGIAIYSNATTANVSSNLTIDNTNKKLNIGSRYSVQDSSNVFKIGSLSSTQDQESIEFHINGSRKVIINEEGRLVASVGSAANPNLKLGAANDGIYGTTNTVQLITNGTSKISISDGNTADIQMNDLVEFGYGLRFGATGETLSSYEEGTWTPAPWVYSGTAPTVVSANGTYTIIGDICHITFQIVVTGSSSSSAAMILDGLPAVAQGDAGNGEQSAGQLFVNTDSNTYDGVPSMFYVSGDKLTMVVQGGSKNSLTAPYGLKAQDYIANWYRPSAGSGITLKGSATYKLL